MRDGGSCRLYVSPTFRVTDKIHRRVHVLQTSNEHFPAHRLKRLPFSQSVVHEINDVTSGHWHISVHHLSAIVPTHGTFYFIEETTCFLLQGFWYAIYDFVFQARFCSLFFVFFFVFFYGWFINSHTNRLLTRLVGKYIITHQHLIVQNDFLPVVEVTTVKNESHFVVESSHNISSGIGKKWLGWNGLQQTGIDKHHFPCVFHSGILTTEARQ